ncbi:hypothetical protein N5P32_08885, partial [Marinomonas pontica]|uniref:hypothetical protein n=1 Tax=Marinomonas pontica TaxID=264739 RepID=UPI002243E9B5
NTTFATREELYEAHAGTHMPLLACLPSLHLSPMISKWRICFYRVGIELLGNKKGRVNDLLLLTR